MQHTPVFLAALADVWNSSKKSNQEGETEKTPNLDKQAKKEKKWLSSVNQKTVPFITDEQKGLVDIVLAIKVSHYRCYAEEVQNILKLQYCRFVVTLNCVSQAISIISTYLNRKPFLGGFSRMKQIVQGLLVISFVC